MPFPKRGSGRTGVKRFRSSDFAGNPKRLRPGKMRRPRVRKSKLTNVNRGYRFSRYATPLDFSLTSPNGRYQGACVFSFDQLINYSEFTSLFDRYMITGVKVTFRMLNNPDSTKAIGVIQTDNATNIYPTLWWVVDHDDSSALTTDQMRERQSVKKRTMRPNSEISIFVKPCVLSQTYRTALTTGYAPKFNTYIDVANVDVPHYALKWNVDLNGTISAQDYKFRVEFKYYFTCRDVR